MILDYYVYILMDSSKPGDYKYDDGFGFKFEFKFEPFYIGKGIHNRIKNTIYDNAPFKYNKIQKLKKNDIKILSEKVFTSLSNNEAIELEKKLIKIIGRRDTGEGTLVNQTDGGDGRLNSKLSAKTRDKISKNRKGKAIGWKHTKQTLLLMSEKQKKSNNGFYGKHHNETFRINQSKLVSGDKHPMYLKKHDKETLEIIKKSRNNDQLNEKIKESCQKFNKEVLMFDLNMNFLQEFKSVKQTSNETGINESIISKCCRGDIKKPTRYYFKYKNEKDKIKNNRYLISLGSYFYYKNKKFKLIKRNKKTCICENIGKHYTIHKNDFEYLFKKQTNDSDIIELYLMLKSYDPTFKLKDNFIKNKNIKIKYVKLLNNSEIFVDKYYIYNDDSTLIIYEDEWLDKKEIIKSRLLNKLNLSAKIGARKCDIREIEDNKLVRSFLNENHIQGFVGSKIKIGLFYKDELVSLMTFGSLRKNLGQKSKKNKFEMLRFCNKMGYNISGGASKLLKHFIKKYNPEYILSYADRRWSDGNLYHKLNFKISSISVPNYYYIINNKREGRFKYRKDILVKDGFDQNLTETEIMHQRGYYRIFDKGSLKFEMYLYLPIKENT